MAHLAADTADEFVRVAASLAGQPDALRDRRRQMRQRLLSTPLLDHARFTRSLEAAYRRMWGTSATRETRAAFEVE